MCLPARGTAGLLVLLLAACSDLSRDPTTSAELVGAATAASYYVSPAGSPSGTGSWTFPWDLATALAGAGGVIHPGDTVWLRGGTYAGAFRTSLGGAAGNPIVFRRWRSERATINGGLRVDGPDLVFWGLEIARSDTAVRDSLPGLEIYGPRTKVINLVIHDAVGQGIGFWDGAVDAEVYGCIVYNNGTHTNLDHGIYVHNPVTRGGSKLVMDNVFFQNLAYGIHAYARATNPTQANVYLVGNVAFDNGTISTAYRANGNIIVGATTVDSAMHVIGNMLYFDRPAGVNLQLGYFQGVRNADLEATGNYVEGGYWVFTMDNWTRATVRNNTFAENKSVWGTNLMVDLTDSAPAGGYTWGGNTYYRDTATIAWGYNGASYTFGGWKTATGLGASDAATAPTPSNPVVFVRPNKYEPGRALVVVFNWPRQGSASVDLSGVLQPGDTYEVRNVQAIFGAPVLIGTYDGTPILVPMSGVDRPAPIHVGSTVRVPLWDRTAPDFDAFIVTKRP